MQLGFKQTFPWGDPTYFREKILLAGCGAAPGLQVVCDFSDGFQHLPKYRLWPKLHTIRSGSRWKAGDKIHMAYGVRTNNYQQFNKGIPELEFVKSVQPIAIKYQRGLLLPTVAIDGRILDDKEIDTLAINDGFEGINDFFNWFDKDFQGQLIHWTDLRY